MHACTIVARNYLPHARVLAKSLTAVHPNSRLTVLVVDGCADAADRGVFRTLGLADIIPDAAERQRLAFIYDVTELSTAVKPLLLKHLLQEEDTASVLYFDPDIEVFDSLDSLWQMAAERGVVLTPHFLSPAPDDGFGVSDLFVLRAGIYNLGFIGVGPGAAAFLDWWWGRLRRYCVSDPDRGLFVDQRWVDYVAETFPYATVRDPGCNVAYWNVHERPVVRTARGFEVNGQPLRFYHFSGFDPAVPYLLSRHQGPNPRILLSEHEVVRELCERYASLLRANGHYPVPVEYAFSKLSDGTRIDRVMRRMYRQVLIDAERSGSPLPPLPFAGDELLEWLNAPSAEAPRLSRYVFALYQDRPDVRHTFPSPHGRGAEAYLHWVRNDPSAAHTIPHALRRQPETSARTRPVPHTDGINVVGYLKAELGVGEIARLLTTAARSEGIPARTFVSDGTISRQDDRFELDATDDPSRYSVTLICANADELPRVVDALPAEMADGCYRIGFWFWETETLPARYQPASELVDEIWVASEYVAAAVRKTVSKPVHVCPLPCREPQPARMSRADLGLPEGFIFLFMFDFFSVPVRKNPVGLIEAFCRAFRPGEGPTLVLKSINGHASRAAFEEIRAAAGRRADLILMDAYLTRSERDALMSTCDCYVSLHRSEGFGLTLAEAMVLEKPTIATAYSGNLAFMTPENSFLVPCRPAVVPSACAPYPEGDRWAEPDLSAAASLMRSVYENPALARERGRKARQDVLDRLSPVRTAAFLRERLAECAQARHLAEEAAAAAVAAKAEAITRPPPPAPRPFVPRRTAQLEVARREVAEAEQMLAQGIRYSDRSRFGWPGRLLRTAIMRVLRPYAHFDARVQQHHLRSTRQVLECLHAFDTEGQPDQPRSSKGQDGPV